MSRTHEADPESDRRPAVCIVRHNYYPDTHVRRDAEALVAAGYDVCVVALRRHGQPSSETMNRVRVYRLPVRHRRGSVLRYAWEYGAFTLLATVTVAVLHLRYRFAAVEVDNMPDILILAGLFPKLTGAKLVFYIFDNMPELLAYLRGWSLNHPLIRMLSWVERLAASVGDRVIVPHERARQIVVGRGTSNSRVTVVLNTADDRVFRPLAGAAVDDRFTIVSHGAILERYGIQVLIDALPEVIAQVPETEVHIFGEGEHRTALEAQARARGVDAFVKFRGFVSLDELLTAITAARVGYVGMLNDLTLPNKLMEYVALGIPVVLARWPAFEAYFSEDAVYYFRPGDSVELARALVLIYRDPEGAQQRARRASRMFREYAWDVQRQKYLGVYEGLLLK